MPSTEIAAWLQTITANNSTGSLVAIRMNISGSQSKTSSISLAARTIRFCESVFQSSVKRLTSQHDSQSGYVSSLVEFTTGQTATICVICNPRDVCLTELMAVGTRRTFEFETTVDWSDVIDSILDSTDAEPIIATVKNAIESCQPVEFDNL